MGRAEEGERQGSWGLMILEALLPWEMRRQEQPTRQVGRPHSLRGKSGDGPDLGQLGQGLEGSQVLGAGQAGASQQALSVDFNTGATVHRHMIPSPAWKENLRPSYKQQASSAVTWKLSGAVL